MLRPFTYPRSRIAERKAAIFLVAAVAESGDRTLTNGFADDDCACAMFRHIAAAAPSSAINSRRFIVLNRSVVLPTPHCASNRKDSTAETAALRDFHAAHVGLGSILLKKPQTARRQ